MDETVIARRSPLARLRRTPTAVLVLRPDGIWVEGRDHVAWADLEEMGRFTTGYGAGLGLRLADPLAWFDEHPGPWRDAAAVSRLGRMPRQNADILGVREASTQPPPDPAARIEWARDQTGGWDLTIPERAISGGVPAAIALVAEYRRRYA